MGFFNKRKKEVKTNNTKNDLSSNMSEFDRDIRALLDRDDMQCRSDICKAEFEKANNIIQKSPQDGKQVMRAYDLMGHLAQVFEYPPACYWMGDFAESIKGDLIEACFWYKKAADLGDGQGARCYGDMLMTGNGVEQNQQLAFQYYALAADRGIPDSAFVMGEYFRNVGEKDKALEYYQKALEGGYEPAKVRINQMKNSAI